MNTIKVIDLTSHVTRWTVPTERQRIRIISFHFMYILAGIKKKHQWVSLACGVG